MGHGMYFPICFVCVCIARTYSEKNYRHNAPKYHVQLKMVVWWLSCSGLGPCNGKGKVFFLFSFSFYLPGEQKWLENPTNRQRRPKTPTDPPRAPESLRDSKRNRHIPRDAWKFRAGSLRHKTSPLCDQNSHSTTGHDVTIQKGHLPRVKKIICNIFNGSTLRLQVSP